MTEAEHAARIARMTSERVERGLPPLIQSEAAYRILAAVITANQTAAEK